jgi:predicted nucleic acid-binding Zn ribbon protein
MPLYEYKCNKCELTLSDIRKVKDRDNLKQIQEDGCIHKLEGSECELIRVTSKTNEPIFKGNGFYSTDY